MNYIIFNESDIENLQTLGVHQLLVEVSSAGSVKREIGLDQLSQVIHRFPGSGPLGKYGILDNTIIDIGIIKNEISTVEFEKLYLFE